MNFHPRPDFHEMNAVLTNWSKRDGIRFGEQRAFATAAEELRLLRSLEHAIRDVDGLLDPAVAKAIKAIDGARAQGPAKP